MAYAGRGQTTCGRTGASASSRARAWGAEGGRGHILAQMVPSRRLQFNRGRVKTRCLLLTRCAEGASLCSGDVVRDRAALSKAANSGKAAFEPGPIRRIPVESRRVIAARSLRRLKLLIRGENPRRRQTENPLKLLSKLARPALKWIPWILLWIPWILWIGYHVLLTMKGSWTRLALIS